MQPLRSALQAGRVLLLGLVLGSCSSLSPVKPPASGTAAKPVEQAFKGASCAGKVTPCSPVVLQATANGAVEHLYCRPGQRVRKGQLLFKLFGQDPTGPNSWLPVFVESPVTGTVTKLVVGNGALVRAGAPLVYLTDNARLCVQLTHAPHAAHFRPGRSVAVRFAAEPTALPGRVAPKRPTPHAVVEVVLDQPPATVPARTAQLFSRE